MVNLMKRKIDNKEGTRMKRYLKVKVAEPPTNHKQIFNTILHYIFTTINGIIYMTGAFTIFIMCIGINPITNEQVIVSFVKQSINNTSLFFFLAVGVFVIVMCYIVFEMLISMYKN